MLRAPAPGRPLLAAALAIAAGVLLVGLAVDALRPPDAVVPRGFMVVTEELGAGGAQLGQGQAWVGQVPVGSLALRDVTATLTWTDDAPGSAPDEFTLELVPPAGLSAGAPAEGAGGTLEVRVPVYPRPPARAELGQGQWSVRVYLRDAGDASTMAVLPGALDNGNDFQLVVTASVFQPR